jgi:hypothetical protein
MRTSRWFLEAVLIVAGGGIGLYLAIHDTKPTMPRQIEFDKAMRHANTEAAQRDLGTSSTTASTTNSTDDADDTMRLGWSQSEATKAFDAWYQGPYFLWVQSHALDEKEPHYVSPVFPKDGTRVKVKVISVSHPFFDSPSVTGDKSTATLTVDRGAIPSHPGVQRILMGFDRYNARSLLEVGDTCTLFFTNEGKFFGYDMMNDGFDFRTE